MTCILYSHPGLGLHHHPRDPDCCRKLGVGGGAVSSLAGPVFIGSREHRQKAALSSMGLFAKWTTLNPGIPAGLPGLGRSSLCPTVLEKGGLQEGC